MTNTERTKYSLKKNDMVQVIAGREKGKSGKILRVNTKTGRITVEKINLVKRHMRPTQQSPQGGILEKETGLHYSNVLLMCPKCNRGVRHGVKWVEKTAGAQKGAKKTAKGAASSGAGAEKVKVRTCKKCGESLDLA
jgi:large subunit ribosomal protein L24